MLWTVLIGFLIGGVAKFFMPGSNPRGIVVTIFLGIGGAMLANIAGNSFGFYRYGEFYSFFTAVIGAMAVLFVYAILTKRKSIE